MSPVLTESIRLLVLRTDYSALSWLIAPVVVGLLVLLLCEQELVRAYGSDRARRWVRTLEVITFPLFFAFGAIVLQRLLYLMGFQ